MEQNPVLRKDFARHVQEVSGGLKDPSLAGAEKLGRRVKSLASSQISKEKIAGSIAAERKDHRGVGLRADLRRALPESFEVYRNPESKRLELQSRRRKRLFLSHYWIHPLFGFMNGRMRTWFPCSSSTR